MPTPLTPNESKDLLVQLETVEKTREDLMSAEAAFRVADSRFARFYRDLRISHGARSDQHWDASANEWVKIAREGEPPPAAQRQPPQLAAAMPSIADIQPLQFEAPKKGRKGTK